MRSPTTNYLDCVFMGHLIIIMHVASPTYMRINQVTSNACLYHLILREDSYVIFLFLFRLINQMV